MYIKSSELYNNFLEIYHNEFNKLPDAEKINFGDNYDPESLFVKEESTYKKEPVDLSDMPPLEGREEEVKKGKGLKLLTPNILLIRLLIKAGHNSYKVKTKSDKYCIFCISTIKSLKKFTKI